jgi:hypothetical protein
MFAVISMQMNRWLDAVNVMVTVFAVGLNVREAEPANVLQLELLVLPSTARVWLRAPQLVGN